MKSAREFLIRHAQQNAYREELAELRAGRPLGADSSLLTLSPFIDDKGLIRVGGRIGKSKLPYDSRHPIILPPDEKFTKMILHSIHICRNHLSTEQLFFEARLTYWIPRGRAVARSIVSRCVLCRRMKVNPTPPLMAPLPACRLTSSTPPFTKVGVDYFGPVEVIIFRRHVKRWVSLFTCLTTRAVHLEVAFSLDTDSFISALTRFESSRGVPSVYYSDNGTNFTGAQRELKECLDRLDQEKITTELARREVDWQFNPPAAPHFGGSWERLVQSAKRALQYILHLRPLTDEILSTAIKQAESLINSRPLTYVTVNPADPLPLTPNHLLLGRANPNIPPDVIGEQELNSKKRWRVAQAIATHFWRRWMREYLPGQTERKRWQQPQRNLKEGDIVLLIDPNNPRGTWPLGRVEQIVTGADGIVRSAYVKTRIRPGRPETQILYRPSVRLCLLIPEEE